MTTSYRRPLEPANPRPARTPRALARLGARGLVVGLATLVVGAALAPRAALAQGDGYGYDGGYAPPPAPRHRDDGDRAYDRERGYDSQDYDSRGYDSRGYDGRGYDGRDGDRARDRADDPDAYDDRRDAPPAPPGDDRGSMSGDAAQDAPRDAPRYAQPSPPSPYEDDGRYGREGDASSVRGAAPYDPRDEGGPYGEDSVRDDPAALAPDPRDALPYDGYQP